MPYQISYNTHNLNLNFYIYKFTPYMGSLTMQWVPLVPEIIGYNDQFVLNVISMANALAIFAFSN